MNSVLSAADDNDDDLFTHQKSFFDSIPFNCKDYSQSEFNTTFTGKTNGLKMLHINARSLKKNFSDLLILLKTINSDFDVIAISETWFNIETNENYFNINNYSLFHTFREHKQGGGVALYVKSCYSPSKIHTHSVCCRDICEIITVEVCLDGKKVILSSIYRPPNCSVKDFLVELNILLENCKQHIWYIMGDFNIDLKSDDHASALFLDDMYSHSFRPLINIPTRRGTYSETLIDNIFTNEIINTIHCGTIITDLSDHLPIFAVVEYKTKRERTELIFERKFDEQSKLSFVYGLQNVNWDSIYTNDIESSYNNFLELFLTIVNKYLPYVKRKPSNKPHQSWITEGLKISCIQKSKYYKAYLLNKTTENELQYKQYKNKLTHLMRIRKKQYFGELLNYHKHDIKRTWRILNEITRRNNNIQKFPNKLFDGNSELTSRIDIVNHLNDYFAKIGPELSSRIEPSKVHQSCRMSNNYFSKGFSDSFYLKPTNSTEIQQIINKCKSKNHMTFSAQV